MPEPPLLGTSTAWAACLVVTAAAAHAQHGGSDAIRSPPPLPRHELRIPVPTLPDGTPLWGSTSCPADPHRVFRVGGVALRLEADAAWSGVPAESGPPRQASERRLCDLGRLARMRWLSVRLAPFTGLPSTIRLDQQEEATTRSGEETMLRGQVPPARTPLGNEFFGAPPGSLPFRGRFVYRLPRIGDGAEAPGPLLVRCDNVEWCGAPPGGALERPHECGARFQMPGLPPGQGVVVGYRFFRRDFDEAEWQALDLRVREWVAAHAVSDAPP